MVTHHAPSYKSVAPEFLHTGTVGAYASDLEPIMYEHDNIVAWCHGHVHDDYMSTILVLLATLVVMSRRTELTNFNPDFTSQYDSALNLINRHFLPGVPDRTLLRARWFGSGMLILSHFILAWRSCGR